MGNCKNKEDETIYLEPEQAEVDFDTCELYNPHEQISYISVIIYFLHR